MLLGNVDEEMIGDRLEDEMEMKKVSS